MTDDNDFNGTNDATFSDKALDAEMRRRCADDEIEPPTYDGMWE